jgi:flagellar biogenesis protein FliO
MTDGPSATPSSIYAKHLASGAPLPQSPAPAAADEISPILTPDLEYEPPPDWPAAADGAGGAVLTDPRVTVASHAAPLNLSDTVPAEDQRRRLAPSARGKQHDAQGERSPLTSIPGLTGRRIGTLVTTLGATSAVAGLILVSMYVLRRGMPGSTAILSDEVVCVLGHKQLSARQCAQLIRIGNKLVLLSVTPEGAKPLAEVTDPVEVDRLLGLCMQSTDTSATREFQDVMNQLSREYPSAESRSGRSGDRTHGSESYLTHPGGRVNG